MYIPEETIEKAFDKLTEYENSLIYSGKEVVEVIKSDDDVDYYLRIRVNKYRTKRLKLIRLVDLKISLDTGRKVNYLKFIEEKFVF